MTMSQKMMSRLQLTLIFTADAAGRETAPREFTNVGGGGEGG
jgi:hypothetical protein